MKIKTIDSFLIRIPLADGKAYAGGRFQAANPLAHPALPADHPGDITTEYPPLWRNRALYAEHNETVIVRIETDSEIVGWGEVQAPVAGEIVQTVIEKLLAPIAAAYDPLDIQPIWEAMYSTMRMRGHSSGYLMEAISGIDIALWDIAGQHLNAPIAKLLGAKLRDRIPVYASGLTRGHISEGEAGIEKLLNAARDLIAQGHRAIKVKLGVNLEQDIAALQRLREAVGADVRIAVDVNGAYDLALARRAGKAMEALKIWWLEEPLAPEHRRDYAILTEFLDIPVAGGECLCTRWDFNDYLANAALDVVQPGVGRAGGISECRRISTLADIYGVPFVPHVYPGSMIYIAAALQWAASGANLMSCELPIDQTGVRDSILKEPLHFEDGYMHLTDAPGLGIHIDENALLKWAV